MVVLRGFPWQLRISWLISKEEKVEHRKELRPVKKMTYRYSKAASSIIKPPVPRLPFCLKTIIPVRAIMKNSGRYQGRVMLILWPIRNTAAMKISVAVAISADG